jgi:ketosteroid isomerase-like protein
MEKIMEQTRMRRLSDQNAAIVRRGYEAFNSGDMDTLTDLFDESALWHTPGRGPIAGDHVGREAVFAQFGHYGGDTGGTFQARLEHLLADDEGRVVGIHRNTAERNGKQLDVDCCLVFELKDGRVTDGREYFSDVHAWDEFWS